MPIDDHLRQVPGALWERMRADPTRAPEHIALAAASVHGPAAAAWLAEQRAQGSPSSSDLAKQVKRRHARLARFEGAATGVGGFLTVLPDLAALAWIQSRLVFFMAAAYGHDPLDPARPAELLVLQDLYDDVPTARAALDGTGPRLAGAWIGRSTGRDKTMTGRLLQMVGKRAGARVSGRLVPGVAMLVSAVGNERDTRALADRASRFYRP